MSKLIISACLLLICIKSLSQGADTATLSLLSARSLQLNADPDKNDSAIALAKTCLRLAEKDHLEEWKAKSLILIGSEMHDRDAAKPIYIQAIAIANQHNFPEIEVSALYNISKIYYLSARQLRGVGKKSTPGCAAQRIKKMGDQFDAHRDRCPGSKFY